MWSNRLSHALTDASEAAADLDAPNKKIAKTAVAATFEEDNVRYCPFDDTLGVLPHGATDEERMLNKKRLQAKLDMVQEAMNDPATMTESMWDAKNIFRWLNKEIAKEHKKLTQSCIKYDKAMERQRTKEYERVDKVQRQRLPPSELQLKLEREQAEKWRVSQSQSSTIRKPQKIIDAFRAGKRTPTVEEQSATAVAASATAVATTVAAVRAVTTAVAASATAVDEQPDEQSDELFSAASAVDAQSATAVEERSAEEKLLTEEDELFSDSEELLRDLIDDQVRMACKVYPNK